MVRQRLRTGRHHGQRDRLFRQGSLRLGLCEDGQLAGSIAVDDIRKCGADLQVINHHRADAFCLPKSKTGYVHAGAVVRGGHTAGRVGLGINPKRGTRIGQTHRDNHLVDRVEVQVGVHHGGGFFAFRSDADPERAPLSAGRLGHHTSPEPEALVAKMRKVTPSAAWKLGELHIERGVKRAAS